ncbi:MAG TPA: glycerol-3-phosphate acyltransferase [Smithellaceae bacterium]|nr:glycerol-3-phosphate acyltransferase [Smithellaceae bacterium]
MINLFIICLIAYLAGSVNFAIIYFKITGRKDPRQIFSGNAGTTNVYRQAGIIRAAFIFILDIGRAIAVAFLAIHYLTVSLAPWAGFFLVLGNSFPCFHHFRGGKGVANYLGFTAVIFPLGALAAALVWVIVYAIARIPFVSSFFMVALLSLSVGYQAFSAGAVAAVLVTFALIVFNHRKNIAKYI